MAPKQLRILCFGDSLTEGYSMYGSLFTPYSDAMEKLLKEKIGDEYEVEVETDGVSGELVLEMKRRMEVHYGPERTKEEPYDFVIFLGGTNDIAYSRPADKVWGDIEGIIKMPRGNGAKVLLMTIPECGVVNEALDERRDGVNGLIKGFAEGKDDVFVLDLKAKMPYHDMDEEEREEIWDDGLHFTPKGYERIGWWVGGAVLAILKDEWSAFLASD